MGMIELHQFLQVMGVDPLLSFLTFLLQIIDLTVHLPETFLHDFSCLPQQTLDRRVKLVVLMIIL